MNADELTVADGTNSSDYVPVYGNWADAYLKCEFVIPAAELADMSGSSVSAMKFYLKSVASAKWTGTFQVFLKEVDNTIMSAFLGTDGATVVYEGQLDGTSSEMTVTFSENYTYNGGNLLVGVYQTEKGNYKSATFYGVGQSYNSAVNGYNSTSLSGISATGRAFIPKTTFTYETAADGPALTVKDGNTKLSSPYSYNFGLATPGTTKAFTLSNPGTEAATVSVSHTGNFGAELSSTSIPAGETATLTVTMPDATGSDVITISSTDEGIDDFVINVSGVVRDPNKMFVDFADGVLPDDWVSVGNKSSYSTYSWTFAEDATGKGYAGYNGT